MLSCREVSSCFVRVLFCSCLVFTSMDLHIIVMSSIVMYCRVLCSRDKSWLSLCCEGVTSLVISCMSCLVELLSEVECNKCRARFACVGKNEAFW